MITLVRSCIERCRQERMVTIPTMITLVRLALLPFLLLAIINQSWNTAVLLFCGAVVTDGLDGLCARYFNQITFLGAVLDACADKLMITGCFAALAYMQPAFCVVPYWFVAIIALKEFLLMGGALVLMQYIPGFTLRPTLLGKSTLVVQALCVGWVLAAAAYAWVPKLEGHYVVSVVLLFVGASFVQYSYIAYKAFDRRGY